MIMKSMEERLLSEYFSDSPEKMAEARKRLSNHEPLAYILGETVFYDETYKVTPAVLIPRQDTERVVEKVLKYLPEGGRLLDICCGSGCIAISSLCHSRNTTAEAVDISEEALAVAKENAELNGVFQRIRFWQADIRRGLPAFGENGRTDLLENGQFDVIVSNPPYVATAVCETLQEECKAEPYIAFDGGEDGGDFYRILLELCPPYLKKGGKLIFEIGYDQRPLIELLTAEKGYRLEIYKDYGKNDRVAVLTLP